MDRLQQTHLFLSRFKKVLSSDLVGHLKNEVVSTDPLPSICLIFDNIKDSALLTEALRCACFSVFPPEILSHGVLIDDRGGGNVEIRFGISETDFREIADAPRKKTDI